MINPFKINKKFSQKTQEEIDCVVNNYKKLYRNTSKEDFKSFLSSLENKVLSRLSIFHSRNLNEVILVMAMMAIFVACSNNSDNKKELTLMLGVIALFLLTNTIYRMRREGRELEKESKILDKIYYFFEKEISK